MAGVYDQCVGRNNVVAALMQPTFLPWAGYFALADAVDVFVFLDDFQFQRSSWHHRNRLFQAPGEPAWLTVPVARSADDWPSIQSVAPVLDDRFKKRFRGMLKHGYGRSEHVGELMPALESWIRRDWTSLADLNIAFIQHAFELLDIRTETLRSSELGSTGRRSARVADLLGRVSAKRYLATPGARDYMVEDGVFPLEDIETCFQEYEPVEYPQVGASQFVPYLSVLDLLLQVGPDRARNVVREGSRPFQPWERLGQT
jgi:hypothetical protein